MKIGELKHNHSLTDLLKVLLFALLMLAPIGSVLTRSLYVICNKNAYQSYYGETINEEIYGTANSQVLINNTYHIYFDSYTSLIDTSKNIPIDTIKNYTSNDSGVLNSYNTYKDRINNITFNNNGTTNLYVSFREDTTVLYNVGIQNKQLSFDFVPNSNVVLTNQYNDFIKLISYNNYSYLDNVFEYSVSKLATDQMFTWTANTPVFTGVQAMCTQLGITAPAIPIIIAYWLILTCVYIVIDIVIKLITYITHLIGARKGA